MDCPLQPAAGAARRTVTAGLLALGLGLAIAPSAALAAPAADRAASAPTPVGRPAADTALGTVGELAAQARVPGSDLAADESPGSSLEIGESLLPGQAIVSPSGQYRLLLDFEGHIVLEKEANWLAASSGIHMFYGPNSSLVLRSDGALIMWNGVRESVQRNTAGSGATSLRVQDDGNLVLYRADNSVAYNFDTAEPSQFVHTGHLLPGERLVSDDRGTTLNMQPDGNLVLYSHGVARYATGTSTPGAGAVLQSDGNFVVYSPTLQPLFSTGSARHGGIYNVLSVWSGEFRLYESYSDDRAVALYGSTWGTNVVEPGHLLLPGDRRTGPGGDLLILQTDGNLVQYVGGRPRFATMTNAAFGVMQTDGNFVLYEYVEGGVASPVFSTGSAGHPGSRLVLQTDGNLVVYTPSNRPVFSSRT